MARDRKAFDESLARLEAALRSTEETVARMAQSGLEWAEQLSVELVQSGIRVALDNLDALGGAAARPRRGAELARDMRIHVEKDIARPQILQDLEEIAREAEAELETRVGRHKNPVRNFLALARALPADIEGTLEAARDLENAGRALVAPDPGEENDMSEENLKAIEAAIQQLGRQLSFLSARGQGGSDLSPGGGSYRSVTAQIAATLDALGMPHHGVQFATARSADQALDTLIESLNSEFREVTRNGTRIYELGEAARRPVTAQDQRLLAGAARTAARRIRAEADTILDILDRLPDLNRFRVERGALSPADARNEVAARFADLDAVLAEPFGINVPRAFYTLRRVLKGLLDYFDFANLEPELLAAFAGIDRPENVPPDLLPVRDPDEVAKRRSPSTSEEIIHEIRELAGAYGEILADVVAPVVNRLGNAAAKLELYLATAHATARDYRDILVRSGTSLPEQDLLAFSTRTSAVIVGGREVRPGRAAATSDPALELTLGQVIEWIIDVAEPFVGGDFRASMRERGSLAILAAELTAQSAAVQSLVDNGVSLGFAISLYGPMRQLEELRYYLDRAADEADLLAGTTRGAIATA